MAISKTTFTILLVSVFVGLLIMTVAFIVTRLKIAKYKQTVIARQASLGDASKVIARTAPGELLWDLRNRSVNPLEDSQLEFLINTALRNNYQTCNVVGSDSKYELVTLGQIAKLRASSSSPDLTIIFNKDTVDNEFQRAYANLKPKQMIAIVNASKRTRRVKNFLRQIKNRQVKYDYVFIGIGIILVVK